MFKFCILILALAITINLHFDANLASATSGSDIVISQIQIGNSSSSRLIELYNNTNGPIDITDWCVYHSSASGITETKLVCFTTLNASTHILIEAQSYILIGSAQLDIVSDFSITKGLGGVSGGHVYIIDNLKVERDSLGWGNVQVNSEGTAAVISPDNSNHILERKQSTPGYYVDTNNNIDDFFDSDFREKYYIGSINDVIDVCNNLADIQVLVPTGYELYENGDCLPPPIDVCSNIDGFQVIAPEGYYVDDANNCEFDVCGNIDGLQVILPEGYRFGNGGSCLLDLKPLIITEMLPNSVGSDDGNEYIEIFNPNDQDVDLFNYLICIKTSSLKTYNFPSASIIKAGEYMSFSDGDISFTLINTSAIVELQSADGDLIDSVAYDNPGEGLSWANINGVWQFTNRPTPGSENLPSYIKISRSQTATDSELQPCAPNQYRNPETNRCKLIEPSSSSVLAPCKVGQYRSEETNRCRNIASDVSDLMPCAEGQERNPATNRCRNIVATNAMANLVPCKEGQERNPETNRCRNIVATSMPVASYAPEKTYESSGNNLMWWSLAAVGGTAIIYGVWEWRQEIVGLSKKVAGLAHLKK